MPDRRQRKAAMTIITADGDHRLKQSADTVHAHQPDQKRQSHINRPAKIMPPWAAWDAFFPKPPRRWPVTNIKLEPKKNRHLTPADQMKGQRTQSGGENRHGGIQPGKQRQRSPWRQTWQTGAEKPKEYWPLSFRGKIFLFACCIFLCRVYSGHPELLYTHTAAPSIQGNSIFCFSTNFCLSTTGLYRKKGAGRRVDCAARSLSDGGLVVLSL